MSSTLETSASTQVQCGSDILVQALINHGVEVVFAYPGGASMPLHQSLTMFSDKIRTILPRHEQGGAFAAQGYARSTGKPGVCMATSGPGATNLVTSIADAKMDSIPLIAITGQVKTQVIGTDAFQETPIVEVCRGITKHHYLVQRIEDLTRVVREAFHIATSGRPGPVLIDLPKDVQQDRIIPDYDAPMQLPGYHVEDRKARPEQIAQVVAAIKRSKRPIIYAGGGIILANAAEELRELVQKTGIPVTTTVMGLGAVPSDDPLSLKMLGMHGTVYANYAVNEADLLLAFGVRFDDRVTGKVSEFAKHGKIVHIDIDPSEINKNKAAHIPIVSDIKFALKELNKVVEAPEDIAGWVGQCDAWKLSDPLTYDKSYQGILPQFAIDELSRQTCNNGAFITVGVGQHQMWTAQWYNFQRPRQFMSSSGLGTMGFGLPCAMGVQVAHPDKIVVDVDGDGSFLMNVQEMATCYCEKLPVKVLLLNNQHLGMVMQWEDRFHDGNRAHTYLGPIDHPEAVGQGNGIGPQDRYPDFVTLAKGFKWNAASVKRKADLPAAIAEMLASPGPYLLDCETPYQEHVLPMIPGGMTVSDLIKQ